MKKTIKTTKRQFELFRDECLRLQKEFGTNEWHLEIMHVPDRDNYASVDPDYNSKTCSVRFNLDMPSRAVLNDERILEVAKHEMIHVMVAGIAHYGSCRFDVNEEDVVSEEEGLVRRLEKLL